jgi:plastocyanin
MYFTRSVMASALMGFAAATNHMMASEAALLASATGSAVGSLSTGAVEASTGVAPAAEGMVVTHVVKVGGPNGTLIFSPNNVVAAAGDLVQFQFNPKV